MIDLDKIALQIAERIRKKATKYVPVGKNKLRESIQVEHTGPEMAVVGSNLAYARAVHDGRPAITIKPNIKDNPPRGYRKHRNPKRARLKFKIGGQTIFARQVHQPARKGNPFLRKAAEEVEREGFGFLMPYLRKEVSEEIAKNIARQIKVEMKI